MNVLIVSQCRKNALKETRRVLDQFAERHGERTWQTPITQVGLDTLRRMLKKTARKNTAVACHWIRGKNHSELLWIVGNATRFNAQGAVPTNTTKRDILRQNDENDWHSIESIRLLAALAALFHDLGKANNAFQSKLKNAQPIADALRHEWVSLRLFQAFVGKNEDHSWLSRLADYKDHPDLSWMDDVVCDVDENSNSGPFKNMPPLAKLVGWLIVSHHRLPTQPTKNSEDIPNVPNVKELERLPKGIKVNWCGSRLSTDGLKGKDLNEKKSQINACWKFGNGLPTNIKAWQKRAQKHASRILKIKNIMDEDWLKSFDPYVLHMSRMVLMLADHHYSSLTDPHKRVEGFKDYPLIANTDRSTGKPNQTLDEHLIGVEIETSRIVHRLPSLMQDLPRIARHKGFKRRSSNQRFRWQDKAYDLALSLRDRSIEQGFFGINMASTGLGKTLANGRIMYALADPIIGARFSIALGLRTLTLQTGEAYRQRLSLGPDDLAVLVGGQRMRELYEHGQYQQKEVSNRIDFGGSESLEPLFDIESYVHYEGSLDQGPLAEWMVQTRGANKLISAPILTCTIDHLIPATESLRGGRQIAPMLRLMTSDLILDEPDDFGLEDLPALTRLVHWAGLLGTRVLLSSATLPPSLIEGLFEAYLRGRAIFQNNRGKPGQALNICTAWFDEFGHNSGEHDTSDSFGKQHHHWVTRRCKALAKEDEHRRKVEIVLLGRPGDQSDEAIAKEVTRVIVPHFHKLHTQHHSVDPMSGKRVSLGLVRMANIYPLIEVTQAIAQFETQSDLRLHLFCYHSQHPLLVRSQIERQLDRLLDRNDEDRFFINTEIRGMLQNTNEKNHIVVVMATAVAEVGRDHDYDWAIVEPSSMRSIIQLAGRVRRHRSGSVENPNILLLDTNIKHLKGQSPAFSRPGFEADDFLLETHSLNELLSDEQKCQIDSRPRIAERKNQYPRHNLVDLEHEHLRAVMLSDDQSRKLLVSNWWSTNAHLSGELQRYQRFRQDSLGRDHFALLYDEEEDCVNFVQIEQDGRATPSENLLHEIVMPEGLDQPVSFWGLDNYRTMVERLAIELGLEPAECSQRYGTVDLPAYETGQGWDYHPALGFRRHK